MSIAAALMFTLGNTSQTDSHVIKIVQSMMADGDHGGWCPLTRNSVPGLFLLKQDINHQF